MPAPLIPILIGVAEVVGAALAGGAIAYLIGKGWEAIRRALYAKKFAILGERGVGKTHLFHFLTKGAIPKEYVATVGKERVRGSEGDIFEMADLELKVFVTDSYDVAGDKGTYAEWRKVSLDADVLLYLFRADKLLKGDPATAKRVTDDARHIQGWLRERTNRCAVVVVGTHCDLLPEFTKLTAKNQGQFQDKFARHPAVMELTRRLGSAEHVKLVVGSMKTIEATRAIGAQILNAASD